MAQYYYLYILFFFVIFQYTSFDEYIREKVLLTGSTITNYVITSVVVFFIIFFIIHFRRIPFNRNIVKLFIFLYCIYLLNFILAPFRNFSWFIYQHFFLLSSFYTASIYANITSYNIDKFSKNIEKIFITGLFSLSAASVYVLINNYELLIRIFRSEAVFNNYIAAFYYYFYWDKLCLNASIAIILCYILTSNKNKIINLVLLTPSLLFVAGMRSFVVGWLGVFLFVKIRNIKIMMTIGIVLLFTGYMFLEFIFELTNYDVRINSYMNTLNLIFEYPFGVGNGFYYTFITENYAVDFSYIEGIKGMFLSAAPESDIVYIFSSFGLVLGLMLYAIFVALMFKIHKQYPTMTQLDKCFSLIFMFFIFAGIGEDFIHAYPTWTIFGLALGAVNSKRNERHSQTHEILVSKS